MGAGLIIAIGAQNAFVLKQGILREHHRTLAWICSLSDALLIILGIDGMGFVFTTHPALIKIFSSIGTIYLTYFSLTSFRSAVKGQTLSVEKNGRKTSLKRTVTTILALTYLNPHVYLDTVVMLGSFGASRPVSVRPFFACGAVAASFSWFFSLAYGGRFLAPLFRKPRAWRILDTAIGILMLYIAYSMLMFGWNTCGN